MQNRARFMKVLQGSYNLKVVFKEISRRDMFKPL